MCSSKKMWIQVTSSRVSSPWSSPRTTWEILKSLSCVSNSALSNLVWSLWLINQELVNLKSVFTFVCALNDNIKPLWQTSSPSSDVGHMKKLWVDQRLVTPDIRYIMFVLKSRKTSQKNSKKGENESKKANFDEDIMCDLLSNARYCVQIGNGCNQAFSLSVSINIVITQHSPTVFWSVQH